MKRARTEIQKQQRRDEILHAVIAQFEAQGFAGTSMRQIAQRAGLTQATLYRYFQDKEDLLCALFDHELERSDFAALRKADAQKTPLARLAAYLKAYVDYWFANPSSYANLFAVRAGPYPSDYAPSDAPRESVARLLVAAGFDEARAGMTLTEASLSLLLAVQGAPALYLGGKAGPWPDREPLLAVILEAMLTRLKLG